MISSNISAKLIHSTSIFKFRSLLVNIRKPLTTPQRISKQKVNINLICRHVTNTDNNENSSFNKISGRSKIFEAKAVQEQVLLEFIKRDSLPSSDEIQEFKHSILSKCSLLNSRNIDGVFLMTCVVQKAFKIGREYFFELLKDKDRLNLASIGSFFMLCHACKESCTEEDRLLLEGLYKHLLNKYQVLDSFTCENATLALSLTPSWREGLKLIEMCKITSEPTSKMYNALITAAHDNKDYEMCWTLLESALRTSININTDTFTLVLTSDEMDSSKFLELLEQYNYRISSDIANSFIENYKISEKRRPKITNISKQGRCQNCSAMLRAVDISHAEFEELKKEFLKPVLIGDSIFIKSKPDELQSFLKFIENVGTVDVVLDGLNIAFSTGAKGKKVSADILLKVVDHFVRNRKKVLVIGRRHMNLWPEQLMRLIRRNAQMFLTDDVSADDPYILYATIKSGLGTIFVSRDQMRTHKYLLKDRNLSMIFTKWQQKHQYCIKYIAPNGKVNLENPLPYLQSIQKSGTGWHLPIMCESDVKAGVPGHLVPQIMSWLCTP